MALTMLVPRIPGWSTFSEATWLTAVDNASFLILVHDQEIGVHHRDLTTLAICSVSSDQQEENGGSPCVSEVAKVLVHQRNMISPQNGGSLYYSSVMPTMVCALKSVLSNGSIWQKILTK